MIITQDRTENVVCKPEYIATNHWQEWVNSGVKPSIIAANIYTELDARQLDEVLNRNNRRKWKHSDKLVPAWVVRGVDPTTGELQLLGVQAKPDNPDIKNGSIQKYLGACDYGAYPLFLKVDDYNYWVKIIQDLKIPVIITEGAKKAACLLSSGYAAISIPGVSTCRKKGRLNKLISQFCGFGRLFYLCFDNDVVTKRPVQLALENLARDLSATGSKVMVISLPEGDAKGVDDYIVENSVEAFDRLVTQAQTIEEWKEDNDLSWSAKQEAIKNRKKSKLARAVETIQQAWGSFLRWNELTQSPELVDEPLGADELRVKIALELDMDVNKDDSVTAIRTLAKQRSYHPIREYLQDVAESYKDVDTSIIDNLSTELFGNDSEICNIYMKRFLIGSVARMMRPGTKMDNALILHGAEGIKKSTFWNVLFGDDWFSDSIDDSNAKDEKMLIHEYWCLEWSEFATVYKHKDIEALKKFLAQKNDSFRKPYERSISKHKRGCVFVGTTNNPEILQDPSGRNRRFWIINVNQEIDVAKLETIRDQLWAAAYYCWQRGDIHYIAERSREAYLQDKENEQYKAVHPWQETIESFLSGKSETYMGEIYDCLQLEPSRRETRHQRTIVDCLKILGWEATKERGYGKDGSRPHLWKKVNQKNNSNFYEAVDRNAPNDDISRESFDPLTDPLTDPLKNSNTPNNDISRESFDPLTDPRTDPVKKETCDSGVNQLTVFDPPTDPVDPVDRVMDRAVDRKFSGVGKGFGRFDPLDEKNDQNKKEKIQLHPSFDKNQTNSLKIAGITGTWDVNYRVGTSHIHLKYVSPDKREGRQSEFIEKSHKLTYKQFREKVEAAIWELEKGLCCDRNFRVKVWSRDINELEPKWVDNCTLISTPNPPSSTMFTFASPSGRAIPKAGLEEFELME
ncbi:DUF3854 domain-containing protein [Plectonema cf. radiosum LEGE 06105]|uniref:DUF3854 domain-containing protein n=1 Tax=Plectonema cf. radiosum LEGE 06105 TaxID=945769 RepID=A0A8J7K365_9CYAN|nr:VapE domain-containing protein [Plectonema radiosum]MBE9213732.1 DUF3854 domain-containing protein [Plectonema cf. radiosum LEGE 06105]